MLFEELLTEAKTLFFGTTPLEEEEEAKILECANIAFHWIRRQIKKFKEPNIITFELNEDTPTYQKDNCYFLQPDTPVASVLKVIATDGSKSKLIPRVPFSFLTGLLNSDDSSHDSDAWAIYQGDLYYYNRNKKHIQLLCTVISDSDWAEIPDELEDATLNYLLFVLCNTFPSALSKKADLYYSKALSFVEIYKSNELLSLQADLKLTNKYK